MFMETLLKMKFPNALKGLKKIYASEILTLLAGILSGVFSYLGNGAGANIEDSKMALLAVLFLCFGILTLVAYILNFIGTAQAGKDESSFKSALLWILIGIALTAAALILGEDHYLYRYLSNGTRMTDILMTIYIIQGVICLANKLGNEEQAQRGKRVQNMIVFIYALSFVFQIVNDFLNVEKISPAVLAACGFAALILFIVAYITFIRLLSKAKKMLQK